RGMLRVERFPDGRFKHDLDAARVGNPREFLEALIAFPAVAAFVNVHLWRAAPEPAVRYEGNGIDTVPRQQLQHLTRPLGSVRMRPLGCEVHAALEEKLGVGKVWGYFGEGCHGLAALHSAGASEGAVQRLIAQAHAGD